MLDSNTPPRPATFIRMATAGLAAFAGTKPALATPLTMAPDGNGSALEQAAQLTRYDFSRDHVLGTSFDLAVDTVRPGDAAQVEQAVLAEISRLSAILSTYDPTSEISRVAAGAAIESSELAELLAAYETWSTHTDGALDARLAHVTRLWREAAHSGQVPSLAALRAAIEVPGALNVDALGKGFIIDRAVAIARQLAPAGLLNIGGDLRAWGDVDWLIGVADPHNPADNAPPLATFRLRNAAVATSGGYARFTTVAGQPLSHIIDPRTLTPAGCLASATIVATDCLTANALSTAGCLLDAARTLTLAVRHGSPGQLIMAHDGEISRGGVFATVATTPTSPASLPVPAAPAAAVTATSPSPTPAATNKSAIAAWPKDFQATVNVAIGGAPAQAGGPGMPIGRGGPGGRSGFGGRGGPGGQKRPYVAIWVEDASHKLVRTLAVLGNNERYVGELSSWYQAMGRPDPRSIRSTTKQTRAPGAYAFVWDGLDAQGQSVPQGIYTIKVEINREHGNRAIVNAVLTCDDQPHSVDLAATVESGATKVEYGPKPTPSLPPATPAPIAVTGPATPAQ